MIIEIENKTPTYEYHELTPGDVFIYCGDTYMKTVDDINNAVDLNTGHLTYISSSVYVLKIKAKLVNAY